MNYCAKTALAIAIPALCCSIQTLADMRPDAHAPISIMGDHTHHKGEFMFSYRYMHMNMGDNLDGNNELSPSQILNPADYNYLVSPLEMEMDMHMFGLMYAPTDRLTLMAMINVVDLTMDHQIRDMVVMMNPNIDANIFTTESDGLGDTVISGIYQLSNHNDANWLLNLGISLPTGSIDEEDIIPPVSASSKSQLPFPMQLGSGTYDLLPGITYTKMNERTSWGAQANAEIRLDNNDNGYSKGNEFKLQAWHAWLINKHVSLSTRVVYHNWQDYDGLDEQQALPLFKSMMNANTVATVNPDLRGGSQPTLLQASIQFGVSQATGWQQRSPTLYGTTSTARNWQQT